MFRNSRSISKGLILLNQVRLVSNHHNKAWRRPESGRIKLNFDGASKSGTNKASIGGVYRNHEGVFLLGYAERIGAATSSVAELVAAKRGLELALENGWLDIWIEGDAEVVVDVLTKAEGVRFRSGEDVRHAEDISVMIPRLKDFTASHIYREGNRVADKLAKLGYKAKKPKIWRDVPPEEVIRLLKQDAAASSCRKR